MRSRPASNSVSFSTQLPHQLPWKNVMTYGPCARISSNDTSQPSESGSTNDGTIRSSREGGPAGKVVRSHSLNKSCGSLKRSLGWAFSRDSAPPVPLFTIPASHGLHSLPLCGGSNIPLLRIGRDEFADPPFRMRREHVDGGDPLDFGAVRPTAGPGDATQRDGRLQQRDVAPLYARAREAGRP